MRTTLVALLSLCAFAGVVGAAAAQPPGPPPGLNVPPPDRAESRELMEQVMLTRLSRRLELSDEQSLMLMRRFSEVREQQQALRQRRSEVLRDLRGVLREKTDKAALERLMTQLKEIDHQIAASHQEVRNAAVGLDLDIWQQASLEVFMSEFEGQMRRIVQQVRGDRPGMGPPHGEMMDAPGRPGMRRDQMQDDLDRPRGPERLDEGLRRRPREGRQEGAPGQRPPRMPDRPRRSDRSESPPEEAPQE